MSIVIAALSATKDRRFFISVRYVAGTFGEMCVVIR